MQPPLAYNQMVADVQPPPPSYDQIVAAGGLVYNSNAFASALDPGLHQTNVDIALSPAKAAVRPSTAALQSAAAAAVRCRAPAPLDVRLMCPLTVDTSVEYEMPASACPPKNCEPLLMVHPQYYEFQRHRRLQGGWCRCQLCAFYGRDAADPADQAGGVDLSAGAVFRQSAAQLLKKPVELSAVVSSCGGRGRHQRSEVAVAKKPLQVSRTATGYAAPAAAAAGGVSGYQLMQHGQQTLHCQQQRAVHGQHLSASSMCPLNSSTGNSSSAVRQSCRQTAVAPVLDRSKNSLSDIKPVGYMPQYQSSDFVDQNLAPSNSRSHGLSVNNASSAAAAGVFPAAVQNPNAGVCQCSSCLLCLSTASSSCRSLQQPTARSGYTASWQTPAVSVCDNVASSGGGKRKRLYATAFDSSGDYSCADGEAIKSVVSPSVQWPIAAGRCAKRSRLTSSAYPLQPAGQQFYMPNFAVM